MEEDKKIHFCKCQYGFVNEYLLKNHQKSCRVCATGIKRKTLEQTRFETRLKYKNRL